MKYTILFLLILMLSCNKDSASNSNGKYYFNCDVSDKHIKLTYQPDFFGESANGVTLNAYAANYIEADATSTQCANAGSYCITQLLQISGQKEGTYNPQYFSLLVPDGTKNYTYIYDNTSTTLNTLTVTITNINHASSDAMNDGYLQGKFSGFITEREIFDTTTKQVNISGDFSIPLN